MNKRIPIASSLLVLALLSTGGGAQERGVTTVPPALVTAAQLEAKLAEVEADPGLTGDAKTKRITFYRKALSNLQDVAANRTRADAFAETTGAAPEQIQRIREGLAAAKVVDLTATPDSAADTPLDQIEGQLQHEQADQAAADAQRGELVRQLAYQQNRPAAIRQRLTAAQEEQKAIAAALQAELAGDLSSAPDSAPDSDQVQARRWGLETRYIALSTEIQALDQELISLPMRLDLITAKRDEASANNDRIGKRVEALKELVNARREAEANQAETAAQRLVEATAGLDPALIRLAEQNAARTAALATIVAQSASLDAEQQQAERLAARIKANFERAQTAEAVGVPADGLGQLLLEHRAALPDFAVQARRASALEREIAAVTLSRLRHLEEAERLADLASANPDAATSAPAADAARDLRRDLQEQRRALLDRQLEAEGRYLERLGKLHTAQAQMLEAARADDAYLREHLFWLPTAGKTRPSDLAKLPEEVRLLLAPERWSELARHLGGQVAASPLFWLALLLSAVLLWKRRALIAALQRTAERPADAANARFGDTLRALLLSLAWAAPWPLLLGVIGWRLQAATQGTGFPLVLGGYVVRTALILYGLVALRAICLPGGLGMAHFRWAEPDVRRLGAELRWFTWVVVPTILVLRLAMSLNHATAGGLVTRLGLLVAALAIGIFFYRIFHRQQGLLRRPLQRADAGMLYRAYPLWFPLLIALPLVLLALILSGYAYTALILSNNFFPTMGMIAALIVLHALAVRWLTLARCRLALQAARERRQTAVVARGQGKAQATEAVELTPSEEADLDLDEANEDSLALLRIGIAFGGALGLYLIWSPVFPALGVLNEVTLWQSTTTVDGDARPLPITLADLGLALVYLIATTVLARRLPALLNMILAGRLQVASGNRYTITTLTTYAVVAIGTVLTLNTLGAQWSQLQWLVAALGVGIGFGLQEIVANFISGLIILFDRPIRIGDIVTVGDTDGVVTRIRIRATTIRNWDRKELLVPNKEFITGRLLNWSLSDQVTRIMVTVGVAYGTDVEQAHALMREAALEHGLVLRDPKPVLSFEGFGDNSLTLILRAFIDDLDQRLATITDLHKAIYAKFQQAGIGIAFPQRDLHLDTREPLRISLEGARPESKPQSHTGQPAGGRPGLLSDI
jgi:potassium efflux system protein